jgi:hypothetical protein
MYRNIKNVEHEMYDHIGSDLGHRNSNRKFIEKLGIPGNHAVGSLQETDTHNTDSNAV